MPGDIEQRFWSSLENCPFQTQLHTVKYSTDPTPEQSHLILKTFKLNINRRVVCENWQLTLLSKTLSNTIGGCHSARKPIALNTQKRDVVMPRALPWLTPICVL